MKRNVELPFRFFGPVTEGEAETLTERILDSKSFQDTLKRFLSGEIEPREFAYETQVIAENEETFLKENSRDDGDAA